MKIKFVITLIALSMLAISCNKEADLKLCEIVQGSWMETETIPDLYDTYHVFTFENNNFEMEVYTESTDGNSMESYEGTYSIEGDEIFLDGYSTADSLEIHRSYYYEVVSDDVLIFRYNVEMVLSRT